MTTKKQYPNNYQTISLHYSELLSISSTQPSKQLMKHKREYNGTLSSLLLDFRSTTIGTCPSASQRFCLSVSIGNASQHSASSVRPLCNTRLFELHKLVGEVIRPLQNSMSVRFTAMMNEKAMRKDWGCGRPSSKRTSSKGGSGASVTARLKEWSGCVSDCAFEGMEWMRVSNFLWLYAFVLLGLRLQYVYFIFR